MLPYVLHNDPMDISRDHHIKVLHVFMVFKKEQKKVVRNVQLLI
jgi:hypothetical protein